MVKTDKNLIKEILTRGVEEIIQKDSLEKKLFSGKRLRVKHGVDPTTPDLHLGYAVTYRKLKALQDLGHQIIFLIGDFTGRFGDPDQQESRPLRSKKEVLELASSYLEQVGKIIDLKKTEIRYNGEWYDKMKLEKFLRIAYHFTSARLLERNLFQKRLKAGREIRFSELSYPILQAYDSVVLKSDLTVIASDQIFNEICGRHLQEIFGQPPQDLLATKLLIGTDGKKKMSQSLGNYIGIAEPPKEQYGKIMSLPDNLISLYLELLTDIPLIRIKKWQKEMDTGATNPRDIKAYLAQEIVAWLWGKKKAELAKKEFEKVFVKKELPSKITTRHLHQKKMDVVSILIETKLVKSRSQAKQIIQQGGVRIDGQTIRDWTREIKLKKGMIIQVGKRRFAKIA